MAVCSWLRHWHRGLEWTPAVGGRKNGHTWPRFFLGDRFKDYYARIVSIPTTVNCLCGSSLEYRTSRYQWGIQSFFRIQDGVVLKPVELQILEVPVAVVAVVAEVAVVAVVWGSKIKVFKVQNDMMT